jgi:hypothetical protein
MNRQATTTIALVLGAVGVLFFLAGVFDLLPQRYANFGGIASLVLSGLLWSIGGRAEDND